MQCQPRGVTRDVRGHVWVTEQQGTSLQRGCLACPLCWPTSCRTLPSSTTGLPFLTAGRRWRDCVHLSTTAFTCLAPPHPPPPHTHTHTAHGFSWLAVCRGHPGHSSRGSGTGEFQRFTQPHYFPRTRSFRAVTLRYRRTIAVVFRSMGCSDIFAINVESGERELRFCNRSGPSSREELCFH